jgi:hypothetical protein
VLLTPRLHEIVQKEDLATHSGQLWAATKTNLHGAREEIAFLFRKYQRLGITVTNFPKRGQQSILPGFQFCSVFSTKSTFWIGWSIPPLYSVAWVFSTQGMPLAALNSGEERNEIFSRCRVLPVTQREHVATKDWELGVNTMQMADAKKHQEGAL